MLATAKNRAKRYGLPFNLTEDDIVVPIFCPVLGIKLERGISGKGGSNTDASPSLDRIIPKLGYVKGNVVVISNRANRMKNNGTPAELRRLADFYTKLERDRLCQKQITKSGLTDSATSTAFQNRKTVRPSSPMRRNKPSLIPSRGGMASNVALIDGDIFAYKAAFGNESVVPLGDDIVHLEANIAETESTMDDFVARITDALKAERIVIALSDDDNFRKGVYESYKENRNAVRKPLALRHAKEYIKRKYGAKIKEGLEADDVLGILCTHPTLIKGKPIIVTIDKDLLQIPGRHYNPDKDVKRMIGEDEGNLNFLMQILTGDSVDNYPGCPGIGPKRATAILDRDRSWGAIVAAYEKAKLTEADAIIQARVARILRHTDYDFKRKEPILWTPGKGN